MSGKETFEEKLIEHVFEKLLSEIDLGRIVTIQRWESRGDGTTTSYNQDINIQDRLVSLIMEKIVVGKVHEEFTARIEKLIGTEEFMEKVADGAAEKLIRWLEEEGSSCWNSRTHPNRESFNKNVRAAVIKIVAQRQADELMAKESKGLDS